MSLYLRDADGSLAPDEAGWGTGKGGCWPCPAHMHRHNASRARRNTWSCSKRRPFGAVRVPACWRLGAFCIVVSIGYLALRCRVLSRDAPFLLVLITVWQAASTGWLACRPSKSSWASESPAQTVWAHAQTQRPALSMLTRSPNWGIGYQWAIDMLLQRQRN